MQSSKNKYLTKQVNLMMKLFRSDDKFSQMLRQYESTPEFGSGSGGCGDDEIADDEDGGEDEEDEEDGDNEKALATIQLFLTREVIREVIHETTASLLWLKLESVYMTKSLANKLHLKDRLYTFRMKLGTSVQDHLEEFNIILIDFQNLDVDIDDEYKAILLVISLPASYKHFKEIMIYGKRETLSFDDVKSALLYDDVEPESGEGLVARGRSSDRVIAKVESDGDVYLAIDTEDQCGFMKVSEHAPVETTCGHYRLESMVGAVV
ncbi:hypothetical protein Tco_1369257 [Tanacetum coccineum]